MFYGKFNDEEDNPSIYNVERDTRSTTPDNQTCVE